MYDSAIHICTVVGHITPGTCVVATGCADYSIWYEKLPPPTLGAGGAVVRAVDWQRMVPDHRYDQWRSSESGSVLQPG